jgi:hypothetical protein
MGTERHFIEIIGDPSRTNIDPEINRLPWLTCLKVTIGEIALFGAMAHPKIPSCRVMMAFGRSAGPMTRAAH